MQCEILADGDMRLFIDAEDSVLLQTLKDEDPDEFGTDAFMYNYFEHLTCNSEYEWIQAEEVGALTEAPMLGIYGEERARRDTDSPYISVTGQWDDTTWVQDVLQCWAFMDYQIVSPQELLLESGEVFFTHG